jgi:hypothetical protein
MGVKLKNNVVGFIDTAISASDVYITLRLGDGAAFPILDAGDYFYATLVSASGLLEIIKVTARTGDLLTALRGQESTTPNSFAAGSRLEMRVTAQSVVDALAQLSIRTEYQTFTGTGATATFTLTATPPDPLDVIVTVDGVVMKYTDDYTISGTTLSFTFTPALNDSIVARWAYIYQGSLVTSRGYIMLE